MSGTGVASYGDLLLTSLVVLGGVCVAAFVVVRVFGRFLATGRARGAHLLDVVARVPLEPRRSLYVVEVAGKTLLVGTSEMGLSVLSELDGNEVDRARATPRPTFADLVKQAWTRRKERGDTASSAASDAKAARIQDGDVATRDAKAARIQAGDVAGTSAAADAEHGVAGAGTSVAKAARIQDGDDGDVAGADATAKAARNQDDATARVVDDPRKTDRDREEP